MYRVNEEFFVKIEMSPDNVIYCTVPFSGVDQSQSQRQGQSQHMVGSLKGAQGRKSTS